MGNTTLIILPHTTHRVMEKQNLHWNPWSKWSVQHGTAIAWMKKPYASPFSNTETLHREKWTISCTKAVWLASTSHLAGPSSLISTWVAMYHCRSNCQKSLIGSRDTTIRWFTHFRAPELDHTWHYKACKLDYGICVVYLCMWNHTDNTTSVLSRAIPWYIIIASSEVGFSPPQICSEVQLAVYVLNEYVPVTMHQENTKTINWGPTLAVRTCTLLSRLYCIDLSTVFFTAH